MAEFWFERDPYAPIVYGYEIEGVLHTRRSAVQEIKVLQHKFFGRMLVLDDVVQLTERDEFFYHEMLAHVPLHSHPSPQRVLIIGGGDGGTLREVLKHPSVASVDLVEIDPEVIEVSRQFFPSIAASFEHSMVSVHSADGAEFLRGNGAPYDVILVDGPDPVGPARSLTTKRFFASAHDALTARGVFAVQSESIHFHLPFVRRTQGLLRQSFEWVDLYAVPLATYAGNWWTFSLASKVALTRGPVRSPVEATRFYCEEVHQQSFVPARVVESLGAGLPEFKRKGETGLGRGAEGHGPLAGGEHSQRGDKARPHLRDPYRAGL